MKPLVKITENKISFIFKMQEISYKLTVKLRSNIDNCQKLVDDLAFGDSIEFYNGGLHKILNAMGIQKRFLYEVFNCPPVRHGYPKSARKNPEWEDAIDQWNIRCRKIINRNFRFN